VNVSSCMRSSALCAGVRENLAYLRKSTDRYVDFVPGYLFQALSYFTWVCWIVPDNVPVNQMFGYSSGLGMSLLTFDWAQITNIGSPLVAPWWAEANVARKVSLLIHGILD
jgi:hypothetical protein